MRSLYTLLSSVASWSGIGVLLTCQVSLRYPPCRSLDDRPSYRSQRLHGTHEHYVLRWHLFVMQHVFMKLGLCHLVVLDDGSPFKGAFIAMYDALNLNYDVLAKCNHKGITVEHFHRFLKKNVTIATEDRGTNDIFVPVGIATGYAWNSAPIDDTDILRSIPAIGR